VILNADFNEVTPIHVGYSLVKAETKSKIYITQLDFLPVCSRI